MDFIKNNQVWFAIVIINSTLQAIALYNTAGKDSFTIIGSLLFLISSLLYLFIFASIKGNNPNPSVGKNILYGFMGLFFVFILPAMTTGFANAAFFSESGYVGAYKKSLKKYRDRAKLMTLKVGANQLFTEMTLFCIDNDISVANEKNEELIRNFLKTSASNIELEVETLKFEINDESCGGILKVTKPEILMTATFEKSKKTNDKLEMLSNE